MEEEEIQFTKLISIIISKLDKKYKNRKIQTNSFPKLH